MYNAERIYYYNGMQFDNKLVIFFCKSRVKQTKTWYTLSLPAIVTIKYNIEKNTLTVLRTDQYENASG